MAEHKTLINQNILIPSGSTVQVTVQGNDVNVRATVFIAGPTIPPDARFDHPAAWNQTWSHVLAVPGGYSVIVDLDFFEEAFVDATLEVKDPNGATWGAAWKIPIQAQAMDTYTLSYGLGVVP